ncbi:hypothetical protein B0A49_06679 [Cryomyces minteri]|uniref:Apple domain-containing protein n=1 Tax=Cryomyces minteri TaxID=331657 RepID=A0A4U0WW30_9PEZI|nr:hypothetical protein B0A49_06679 [Cryomyces minteri]
MRSSPVLLLTTLFPLLATSTPTPLLHRYRLALAPRAGAPAIVSIPANCTVTNPLPPSDSTHSTTNSTIDLPTNTTTTSNSKSNSTAESTANAADSNTTTTYAPSPNAAASLLYAFYLAQPTLLNTSALFTQCLEQCYGYGLPGSCRSAVLAENVPVPDRAATASAGGAGVAGGVGGSSGSGGGNATGGGAGGSGNVLLGTACLMFSRELGTADWVVADRGTWTAERAGVIGCPG